MKICDSKKGIKFGREGKLFYVRGNVTEDVSVIEQEPEPDKVYEHVDDWRENQKKEMPYWWSGETQFETTPGKWIKVKHRLERDTLYVPPPSSTTVAWASRSTSGWAARRGVMRSRRPRTSVAGQARAAAASAAPS